MALVTVVVMVAISMQEAATQDYAGRDDHINIGCKDGILQPILEADADPDVMEGEDCPEVTSA